MTAGDTYGNTVYVKANELFLEAGVRIPGVTARKPARQRSRFDLLVVGETNTAIYVWRFSDDPTKPRSEAQFKTPVSGLQSAMASLSRGRSPQLTFEEAGMSDEELAERDALDAALSRRGSVVFLAFGASRHAGLFSAGLAQVRQLDDDGHIQWDHWENLPSLSELSGGDQQPAPVLRVVRPEAPVVRFDLADDADDDLGIRPRRRDEAEGADAESATGGSDESTGTADDE